MYLTNSYGIFYPFTFYSGGKISSAMITMMHNIQHTGDYIFGP